MDAADTLLVGCAGKVRAKPFDRVTSLDQATRNFKRDKFRTARLRVAGTSPIENQDPQRQFRRKTPVGDPTSASPPSSLRRSRV